MNWTKPPAYTSNEGPIRRPRPGVDVALTVGIGLLLSVGVDQAARRERLPEALVFAAIWVFAAVFVLRRFAPLSAMVVGAAVLPVVTVTPWFLLVWMAMATVAYGAQSSTPRAAVCALGMSFVAESTVALLVEAHAGRQAFGTGWPVQLMIVELAAWVTGWSAARGRAHTEGLRRQAEQRAAVQVARARRAVSEERLDIARELHDVVAHSLSVIAVQSGVGNHVIHTRPAQAAAALAAIEEVSRSALIELRSLVGLLRDGDAAEYSPGALADLEGLLARSAQAGVRVDATVSGGLDELPHGLDRAAYRIVQEALTNVAKHARTDRARLTVSVDDAGIGIEVVDDGVGRAESGSGGSASVKPVPSKVSAGANGAAAWEGSEVSAGSAIPAIPAISVGSAGSAASSGEWDRPAGHGLIGMRERAALYGGRVSVGPRAEGGFRVVAWLPVPKEQPVYVGTFGTGETGAA